MGYEFGNADDAYHAGRRAAEREWMQICIRLMKTVGVTQVDVPASVLAFATDRIEATKSPDGDLYRIKGEFELEPSHD